MPIYVCPLTEASYVINSILTPNAPFLCSKHIAICPTIRCIYSCYQVYALDVPKLCMSYDNKQIGSTLLHLLESQFSSPSMLPTLLYKTNVGPVLLYGAET